MPPSVASTTFTPGTGVDLGTAILPVVELTKTIYAYYAYPEQRITLVGAIHASSRINRLANALDT